MRFIGIELFNESDQSGDEALEDNGIDDDGENDDQDEDN
jgi:hypothetical protein